MFDLVVNGGGVLTVRYEKAGFLPVDRQVTVPWESYAVLPQAVMIAHDPTVTTVDLTSATPIQVVQGGAVTDSSGTRRATLFVRQGTAANLVFADGSTQPITTLNIRATEYTVGTNGPAAMPGALPASSAYTYAVEFSADEAESAGATTVSFSQPVIQYLENFLGLPVGTDVPEGGYDRTTGLWVATGNGRIVKILSITSGLANLDIDGSGQAASASALAALGVCWWVLAPRRGGRSGSRGFATCGTDSNGYPMVLSLMVGRT
jgi:hypothetical protein